MNSEEQHEQPEVPANRESLDVILSRIDELVAQREKITEAISAHKKAAQRIIGRM